MNSELILEVKENRTLSGKELSDIIGLCSRAFNEDYRKFLDVFTDPVHVLGYHNGTLVSHALWITRWLQAGGSPLMRTAFIEGVATEDSYRKSGFASAVMVRLAEEITEFDIGGLCTGSPGFYTRLGWKTWQGPLFARKDDELISTPGGPVMVLPLPKTPELELSLPLSVEWREGEVW